VMLTSYGDPNWAGVRKEPPVGAQWVVKSEVNDASVLQVAIETALADPHAAANGAGGGTRAGGGGSGSSGATRAGGKSPISDAQMQILRLVAAGHTNAEIAKRRTLTEDAVNKAITRLLRQLDIKVDETSNARVLLTRAYNQITGSVSERRN
jgi:DNA-binding CsgD family transcriptional regulator